MATDFSDLLQEQSKPSIDFSDILKEPAKKENDFTDLLQPPSPPVAPAVQQPSVSPPPAVAQAPSQDQVIRGVFSEPQGSAQIRDIKTIAGAYNAPEGWLERNIKKSAVGEAFDAQGVPVTSGQAFVSSARQNLGPTAGGIVGGAGAGLAASSATANPYVIGGATILGGLGGAFAEGAAQDYLFNKYMDPQTRQYMDQLAAQERMEKPGAALLGGLAPMALGGGFPSLGATVEGANFVRTMAKTSFSEAVAKHPEGLMTIANSLIGGSTQTAIAVKNGMIQKLRDGDPEAGIDALAIFIGSMGQRNLFGASPATSRLAKAFNGGEDVTKPFMSKEEVKAAYDKLPDSKKAIADEMAKVGDDPHDAILREMKRRNAIAEPQDVVKTAVMGKDGKVIEAPDDNKFAPHEKIEAGADESRRGFITRSGDFIGREDAAKLMPHVPTEKESGKLHSGDLRKVMNNGPESTSIGAVVDDILSNKDVSRYVPQEKKFLETNKWLNRLRNYMGERFQRPTGETADVAAGKMDAVDNGAAMLGQKAGHGVSLGHEVKSPFWTHDKKNMKLEAAGAHMMSNGDIRKLDEFDKMIDHPNNNMSWWGPKDARLKKELHDAVQYAREHYNDAELKEITYRGRRALVIQEMEEIQRNVSPELKEKSGNWLMNADGKFRAAGHEYDTPFHSLEKMEVGGKMRSINLADLVAHRVTEGQRAINKKAWAESLTQYTDPVPDGDGKKYPMAIPVQPGIEVKAPYVVVDFGNGVKLGVKKSWAPYIENLYGLRPSNTNPIFKLALQAEQLSKAGKLMMDTFHLSKMAFFRIMATGKLGNLDPVAAMKYSPSDYKRAVDLGLITPEQAAYGIRNDKIIDDHVKAGLNIGRISNNMKTEVIHKFPVIGGALEKFNHFLFDTYVRSAMTDVATTKFHEMKTAHPEWSEGKVIRENVKATNALFGNLVRQGAFRHPEMTKLMQAAFLAPQWVEAGIRREVGAVAGIPHAVKTMSLKGNTLLQFQARALGYMALATQILNIGTKGKFTWENEEADHKMDAWIPNPAAGPGEPKGFWLSPFSLPAELTHDMIRYSHASESPNVFGRIMDAASQVGKNKLSPLARAMWILATGEVGMNQKVTSPLNKAKAMGLEMAPLPIPLTSLTGGQPGQGMRQLLANAGVKTEPQSKAATEIRREAMRFVTSMGRGRSIDVKMLDGAGYSDLDNAMSRMNTWDIPRMTKIKAEGKEEAKMHDVFKALDDLRTKMHDAQILERYGLRVERGFTGGGKQMESAFVYGFVDKDGKKWPGLPPRLLKVYEEAIKERHDTYERVKHAIELHPDNVPKNLAPTPYTVAE